MNQKARQYLLYLIFAIFSTLINLLTQIGVERVLFSLNIDFFSMVVVDKITLNIIIKMFIATVISFIFKFIVDKIVIFQDKTTNLVSNLKKIVIYGSFAVFTTLIFWGFELGFKFVFHFQYSEYIGGTLGLIIGYTLKFLLDSRYVFK
ncbi:MAG TPA: GtrA family protein [Spirochaetota bacterium]|mgnify:CR=1 FL=1|nr:GtrA family protein [Spirochaetota bacterium]